MAGARYSVEEIVELLKRSTLRTVVVEGGTDIEVLRDLEATLKPSIPDIDFFDAGDKNSVLEVWLNQTPTLPPRTSFVADSDLWIFTDDRGQYPGVIFIDGYSIENCCVTSPAVSALVQARANTAQTWNQALESLVQWFSAEVWFAQRNEQFQLNRSIDGLLDYQNGYRLTTIAQQRVAAANQEERQLIEERIKDAPLKFIIGKMLFRAMQSILDRCENRKFKVDDLMMIGSKTGSVELSALGLAIVNSFA